MLHSMKIKHRSKTTAEKRLRIMHTARRTISLLLLLLCAVPMFGGGVQALWVIPAAICIAMYEPCGFSMAAGVLAGLLIDLACSSHLGANAIFMVCFCTGAATLYAQVLRRTFLNFFWMVMLCTFGRAVCSYLFTAVLFQVEGQSVLWNTVLLPSALLTLFAAIPVYLLYLPGATWLRKRVKSMDAAAIHRH